jgi:hypothetical protein
MTSTQKTRAEAEMRRAQVRNIAQDSARYRRAQPFLVDLRKKWQRKEIDSRQYSEIRKMATDGNLDGAIKALGIAMGQNAEKGARF